jgi:hypothetical protein
VEQTAGNGFARWCILEDKSKTVFELGQIEAAIGVLVAHMGILMGEDSGKGCLIGHCQQGNADGEEQPVAEKAK